MSASSTWTPPACGRRASDVLLCLAHRRALCCTRRQLRSTGKDVATQIMEIIAARGKMHNPVTNSGGVLVGRVREVGSGVAEARGAGASDLRVGQLIVPVRFKHTCARACPRVAQRRTHCLH